MSLRVLACLSVVAGSLSVSAAPGVFDFGSGVAGGPVGVTSLGAGSISFTVSASGVGTARTGDVSLFGDCTGFEGTGCTGGDPDLASEFPPDPDSTLQTSLDAGQILILSEDPLSVAEANGGIFPDPDDLAGRGDIVFSFDADMELTRFDLFDTEEGNLDVFVDGTEALSDLGVESNGQFLRTALLPPLLGRTFTFSFSGSGALDNLDFRNPEFVTREVPLPAALPFLATGLGLLGWPGWRRRAGD